MSSISERLHRKLQQRLTSGNLRQLKLVENLADFSSNDYLGLAQNKELSEEIVQRHHNLQLTNGSSGSRLLTGNSAYAEQLEDKLGEIFGGKALLFSSGYLANLAVLSSVPQRGDTVIYDEAIHTCIKEGVRLSNARHYSFRHNDIKDLVKKLKASKGPAVVVIESIYSMEGDWADLSTIMEVCKDFNAELIIDEAHTTGWYGPTGAGWVRELGLEDQFLARIYTFGKALGAQGGVVIGEKRLIDYLVNMGRPFIYTTAPSDWMLCQLDVSWDFIGNSHLEVDKLNQNINLFNDLMSGQREFRSNPRSPIQLITAGGNKQAVAMADFLFSKGFDVRPILAPTVKPGSERLRICLHSFNTADQIVNLAENLKSKL